MVARTMMSLSMVNGFVFVVVLPFFPISTTNTSLSIGRPGTKVEEIVMMKRLVGRGPSINAAILLSNNDFIVTRQSDDAQRVFQFTLIQRTPSSVVVAFSSSKNDIIAQAFGIDVQDLETSVRSVRTFDRSMLTAFGLVDVCKDRLSKDFLIPSIAQIPTFNPQKSTNALDSATALFQALSMQKGPWPTLQADIALAVPLFGSTQQTAALPIAQSRPAAPALAPAPQPQAHVAAPQPQAIPPAPQPVAAPRAQIVDNDDAVTDATPAENRDFCEWSPDDWAECLRQNGLGRYAPTFIAAGITGNYVFNHGLSDETLTEMLGVFNADDRHLIQALVLQVSRPAGMSEAESFIISESDSSSSSTLTDLRQSFDEYERLTNEDDKEVRLPILMHMFSKEFVSFPPLEITDRFRKPQLRSYSSVVARRFVLEVNIRAASGATDEASIALEKFLSVEDLGVLLVSNISILAHNGASVESMSQAALPSTIAKTLYLFLDLPPLNHQQPHTSSPLCVKLQDTLSRLCEFQVCVEDLLANRDLDRLFETMSTFCPESNAQWRRAACYALRSIANRALNDSTLTYISTTQCITKCVDAFKNFEWFSLTELCDIVELTVALLKMSSSFSFVLLDEFRHTDGYHALATVILSIEKPLRPEDELLLFNRMVDGVAQLVFCGLVDLSANLPKLESSLPSTNSSAIRNIVAFRELQELFLQAKFDPLRLLVLSKIREIFAINLGNFQIVSSQLIQSPSTVCMLLDKAVSMSADLLGEVMKILELLVFSLKTIPVPELTILAQAVSMPSVSVGTLRHVLHLLVKFVNFDSKFADVARDVGFMDFMVGRVQQIHNSLKETFVRNFSHTLSLDLSNSAIDLEADAAPGKEATIDDEDFLLMECLALLLANSLKNIELFRSTGGARALYNLIPLSKSRSNALRVVQQLIISDTNNMFDDLSTLLELMQSTPPTNYGVRIDILTCLMRLFSLEPQLKHSFRECHGFVYIISVFTTLSDTSSTSDLFPKGARQSNDQGGKLDLKHELIKVIFKTLTTALERNSVNKHYFLNEVGYSILADSLKVSGLLQTRYANEIIVHLFAMATETFGRELDFDTVSQQYIANAHVMNVIVMLVVQSMQDVQLTVFERIIELVKKESNAQNLSNVGFVANISTLFKSQLSNPSDPLYPLLFKLVKQVASFRVSAAELRAIIRLRESAAPVQAGYDDKIPIANLKAVVEMALYSGSTLGAPFLDFNLSKGASGLVIPGITHIPGLNALPTDRPWPPQNGFSFSCWLRLEEVADQAANILTLFCPGEPEFDLLNITIEPATRYLSIKTTELIALQTFKFDWNHWYHIGISVARSKFRHCQLIYYINGHQADSQRIPYLSNGPTQASIPEFNTLICARIGQSAYQQAQSQTSYQIAALYFAEDIFPQHIFQILHQVGPSYAGNLQSSLRYLQGWDYVPPKIANSSAFRTRTLSATATTGMIITPQGLIDLNSLALPLVEERKIWISIQAREFFRTPMVDALNFVGGAKHLRPFSREIGERDIKAILRSMRNCVPLPPLYGFLTGRSRAFTPCTVATTIDLVGGMSILIKLIADAPTMEYLFKAMELFVLCVKQSPRNSTDMKRRHSYQLLGGILSGKHTLFSPEFQALLFELTLHDDGNGFESSSITNIPAFQHLLLDFNVWKKCDPNLLCCLYINIRQLVTKSSRKAENIAILRSLDVIDKLLLISTDSSVASLVTDVCIATIGDIISADPTLPDFQKLAHFLIITIDKQIVLNSEKLCDTSESSGGVSAAIRVRARNRLLKLFVDFSDGRLAQKYEEMMIKGMGPNFFCFFLQENIHDSTVLLVLKILTKLLRDSSAVFISKFKAANGFLLLSNMITAHKKLEDVYMHIFAMLFGYVHEKDGIPFSLPSLHSCFQFKDGDTIPLVNPDALGAILALLRALHLEKIELQPSESDKQLKCAQTQDESALLQSPTKTLRMCHRQHQLRVHSEMDLLSPIIGVISFNETVQVLEENGTWLKIVASPDWEFPESFSDRTTAWVVRSVADATGALQIMLLESDRPFTEEPQSTKSKNPFESVPVPAAQSKNPFLTQSQPTKSSFFQAASATTTPVATTSKNPFLQAVASTPISPPPLASPTKSPEQPSKPSSKFGGWATSFRTPKPVTNPFHATSSKDKPLDKLSAQHLESIDPFAASSVAGSSGSIAETIVKYLLFLYRRSPDFAALFLKPERIENLIFVLFAPDAIDADDAEDPISPIPDLTTARFTPGEEQVKSPKQTNFIFSKAHPNSENFFSLLRFIILDQMNNSKDRGIATLDLMLDATPNVRRDDLNKYHMEIFTSILSHLCTSKSLTDTLHTTPKLVTNIGKFAIMVHDRVMSNKWTENESVLIQSFSRLVRQVVDENGAIFSFAESAHGSGVLKSTVDSIFRCINRLTLLLITRPHLTTEQLALAVNSIMEEHSLVFTECNRDSESIACLTYRAVVLLESSEPALRISGQKLWRALLRYKQRDLVALCASPVNMPTNALAMTVEELTFKIAEVRFQVEEMINKAWSLFNAAKQKAVSNGQGWFLTRKGQDSKRGSKRAKHEAAVLLESRVTLSLRHQLEHSNYSKHIRRAHHKLLDERRLISTEWKRIEAELHRERGIWGASVPNPLDKWQLDEIEGPSRMRKRLKPNPTFYIKYPYYPDTDATMTEDQLSIKKRNPPTSFDSKEYYDRYINTANQEDSFLERTIVDAEKEEDEDSESDDTEPEGELNETKRLALMDSTIDETVEFEDEETFLETTNEVEFVQADRNNSEQEPEIQVASPAMKKKRHERNNLGRSSFASTAIREGLGMASSNPLLEVDEITDDAGDDEKEDPVILRLIDSGDSVKLKDPASRVSGLDPIPGVFLLCESHAYFLEGYELSARGIRQVSESSQVIKWRYDSIRDIRRRRHILQERGIEVFSVDGNNHLLVFADTTKRETILSVLTAKASLNTDASSEALDVLSTKLEKEGIFSALIGSKTVTQRWEAGDITNFEYLMYLNSLAGRSYNDLNQYPVFPWVIADYDSDELNLDDACSFRDLGKPMGAQTPARAECFKDRFESWVSISPDEETPAFHYGTHYSSAAIVSSYLVRVEPFASHFIKLQGGKFDHPDRMFLSIKESWLSASERNNGDVKELIPEMFYLPELLRNSNRFDFGIKQNGEIFDHVKLPPWAKDDPTEFMRIQRQALESEYVSSRLHEWIDLIFGYKQQGDEAVKALNVFHHLTYEGAVDIDAIDDPIRKRATISIIDNFGQTPKQLFKKPHPQRKFMQHPQQQQWISRVNLLSSRLVVATQPIREIQGAVGSIISQDSKIFVSKSGQVLLPPTFTKALRWVQVGDALALMNVDMDTETFLFEGLHVGRISVACLPEPRTVITGGTDSTIRVWDFDYDRGRSLYGRLRLVKTLCGHNGPVTCIVTSPSYSVFVSGSEDETCIMWDLIRCEFIRQLRGHLGPIAAVAINNRSGEIVSCSTNMVYMWSINGELLAQTLGNNDAAVTCCAMSDLPEWSSDQVIAVGYQDGRVRLWSRVYNAKKFTLECVADVPIQTMVHEPAQVTCLRFSADLLRLFVGDVKGRLFSWSLPDVSGKSNEHWVKDSTVNTCMNCHVRFSFAGHDSTFLIERRHHCRNCGKVFCGKCSNKEAAIPALNITKPVRVCGPCFTQLGGIDAASNASPPTGSSFPRPQSYISLDTPPLPFDT